MPRVLAHDQRDGRGGLFDTKKRRSYKFWGSSDTATANVILHTFVGRPTFRGYNGWLGNHLGLLRRRRGVRRPPNRRGTLDGSPWRGLLYAIDSIPLTFRSNPLYVLIPLNRCTYQHATIS